VVAAAAMWALNGSLTRFLLDDDVPAARLAQLRSAGAFVLLLLVLAATRPGLLRVRRSDLPSLAFLGIAGLAVVHTTYLIAIDHLTIGAALTIQYLAPVLILVWLRLAHGRRLRPSLWGAVGLSVAGCFLVVRAYDAGALDAVGVAAALASAVSFAIYVVGGERQGARHEPVTTLVWAFGFASLFWLVATPWWNFPFADFADPRNALLGLALITIGTLVPFVFMVTALRHIPASRAAIVATAEPVLAALFAFLIHDEALAAVQIAGGLAVVAAVIWVQSQRPDLAAEAAPGPRAA